MAQCWTWDSKYSLLLTSLPLIVILGVSGLVKLRRHRHSLVIPCLIRPFIVWFLTLWQRLWRSFTNYRDSSERQQGQRSKHSFSIELRVPIGTLTSAPYSNYIVRTKALLPTVLVSAKCLLQFSQFDNTRLATDSKTLDNDCWASRLSGGTYKVALSEQ